MTIDLSKESVPSLAEQLSREYFSLTWVEYATYLYEHEDMSFSEEQCLLISGNVLENYDVDDIAVQTDWDKNHLSEENSDLDFDKYIHTREAELEIYRNIIPAEPMRLIGKFEGYFGSPNGCDTIHVFISVGKNLFVSIWHQYKEEQETDYDIFSFTNYKHVNEFKTYKDYETFMQECQWSPKNINYQNEDNILDGELYKNYVRNV